VASTSRDIDVVIIDHDGDKSQIVDTSVEKVYGERELGEYMAKVLK